MQGHIERKTYKIEEAGRLLGIGRNQAYEAARRGEIPTIRIGKRILVPKAAFDRLLETGLPFDATGSEAALGAPAGRQLWGVNS